MWLWPWTRPFNIEKTNRSKFWAPGETTLFSMRRIYRRWQDRVIAKAYQDSVVIRGLPTIMYFGQKPGMNLMLFSNYWLPKVIRHTMTIFSGFNSTLEAGNVYKCMITGDSMLRLLHRACLGNRKALPKMDLSYNIGKPNAIWMALLAAGPFPLAAQVLG